MVAQANFAVVEQLEDTAVMIDRKLNVFEQL